MPSHVVMPGRSAPVADVDTVATLMLVVFAAGVGWFQWPRHYGEADRVVNDWLTVLVDARGRLDAGGRAGDTQLRDGQP
jgi:hypothetical protein